ncbi:MAG TPA: response regulator transcription factor [Bryobacteraceae bacterium]|nr:response regulator transcription factor [Bryobacteraceae bacterium]
MRLVLADDHFGVRERIKDLVAGEHEVLADYENCESVLSSIDRLCPELVLLDISMPAMGGFSLAEQIHHSWPAIKIIFVTQHSEPAYIDKALHVGASGYVLKRNVVADLLLAIREVSAGHTFLSPQLSPPS